ncbi:MAG: hypothetical protein QM702_21865 [Rubrivivax sp.]
MVVLEVLAAAAVLLALMIGWIRVQEAAARFAAANPDRGPFRVVGGGCGGHGHGDDVPPPPSGPARVVPIAAAEPAATAAGGCGSCSNTACEMSGGSATRA